MVIIRNYRNINVTFAEHTKLDVIDSTFTSSCKNLDKIVGNLLQRYHDEALNGEMYIFQHIKGADSLTIYLGVSRAHNPYLFIYNDRDKSVSSDIPFEIFKTISNPPFIYMIEDAIKEYNLDRYGLFANTEVLQEIRNLADEYDRKIAEQARQGHYESQTTPHDTDPSIDAFDAKDILPPGDDPIEFQTHKSHNQDER